MAGSTFLRVTLPLAGMNVANQASRAAMAVVGPLLAAEFSLSAGGLGMLAAVLFAAYGLSQLPVGLALDLYGARRVSAVLAATAATGFAVAALAPDALTLGLGRALSGIGVSAGLMAMIKANTAWYPRDRVAGATGAGVFVGATGGLLATLPAQAVLPEIGWRGVFWALCALTVAVGVAIWLRVPDAPPGAAPRARRSLGTEVAEFGRIAAHPRFVRLVPSVVLISALNFTYQGLWAGPWLRDVGALGGDARAGVLFVYALGLMAGSLLTGHAASALQRRGRDAMLVPYLAMGGAALAQAALALAPPVGDPVALGALWAALAFCGAAGPAGYAAVGQGFSPDLAGRVATAINATMLALVFALQTGIGWLLDLWPRTAEGGWDARGYAWAFGGTLAFQALAAAWLFAGPREKGAA